MEQRRLIRRPGHRLALALCLALAGGPVAADEPPAPEAQFAAALQAYHAGRRDEAATLFRRLADAGDPQAQYNLAVLYHTGHGLPRHDGEALFWAWRAKLGGLPQAAALARQLARDRQAEAMPALADRLMAGLQPALAAGDPRAAVGAAMIALELRSPPDRDEAIFWQSLAAALGLPGADTARDRSLAELLPAERDGLQDRVLERFRNWCADHPAPPDACAAAS